MSQKQQIIDALAAKGYTVSEIKRIPPRPWGKWFVRITERYPMPDRFDDFGERMFTDYIAAPTAADVIVRIATLPRLESLAEAQARTMERYRLKILERFPPPKYTDTMREKLLQKLASELPDLLDPPRKYIKR